MKDGTSLDRAGFAAHGSQITKKGTPSGDDARFNKMPPGQDITNQDVCDINDMPMKRVVAGSYPGDGAF